LHPFYLSFTVSTATELSFFNPHIEFDYIEYKNVGVGERLAAAVATLLAELECLSV
jgi:hypothetical protein